MSPNIAYLRNLYWYPLFRKIKILSNAQEEIPSGSAFVTFNQKYTYAYGDDWIIE